jgi:hypothetical protein
LPELPAKEDRAENGQNAGNVIQSDVMQHLPVFLGKGLCATRR